MKLSYKSTSPEQTIALGRAFGSVLMPGDVVLLSGDLGAGKTQFVKGIAEALEIDEPITSPTFNIMFEHYLPERLRDKYGRTESERLVLRHFDLYRLANTDELYDIDYFGLLESDGFSVVEWGDKFPEDMPKEYLLVTVAYIDEATRKIDLEVVGHSFTVQLDGSEAEALEVLQGLTTEAQDGAKEWLA